MPNSFISDPIVTQMPNGAVWAECVFNKAGFGFSMFEELGIIPPANAAQWATKRQAEFLAGRYVARQAAAALGHSDISIGTAPLRAPIWPDGLTGSISHCDTIAICLLSANITYRIGIDIEEILDPTALIAVDHTVISDADRHALKETPFSEAVGKTIAFSAKETIFKALYPDVGRHFGFTAAQTVCATDRVITLQLTEDLTDHWHRGKVIDVQFELRPNHVVTWICN